MRIIKVVVERNEEVFFSYIPAIPGCTAGGRTYDELKKNMSKIIEICRTEDPALTKRLSKGYRLKFVVDFESVFKLIPEINISILAEKANMNAGLLRQYASGAKKASEKQAEKINEAIGSLAQKLSSLQLTA